MNLQEVIEAINTGNIIKVYDDIVFFENVYFKKEGGNILTSTDLVHWYNATASISAYNIKNAKVINNEQK